MRRPGFIRNRGRWPGFLAWVGVILLSCSIFIGILGHLIEHGFFSIHWLVIDFYANAASEIAGIAFTVLVIDALNRQSERREDRKFLLRQMASRDNSLAEQAVESLREEGWLEDGTCRHAKLHKANLVDTNLRSANLEGADLSQAHLENANLTRAILSFCNLAFANLNDAQLEEANLEKAELANASLVKAHLINANFDGANIRDAHLESSTMIGAKLPRSRLDRAHLRGAILTKANLRGSSISLADLEDTDLAEANLRDLQEWTDQQFRMTARLWKATMPDGHRYDGRYNLPKDIEEAVKHGRNPALDLDMASWYDVPVDYYLRGQNQ
jgi:hypothetical protein